VLALLAACGRHSEGSQHSGAARQTTLFFSNWAGEIGPGTLPGFEQRTGMRVVVDELVDNVTLQTRLLTGHSGIDVAVPGSNFLGPLIAAGALRKLDKARLPNWHHLDPAILAALGRIDPGNQYGVPYVWGTQAFAYNRAAVAKALGREPEPSWKLIFDPAYARRLASCGIAWQDSAGSIMVDLGLLAIGRDPAGESATDLKSVEDAFMRVRPYVRYIDSSDRFRTDLASGEICIAIGSNGELLQTRELAQQNRTGVDVRYVVPEEGALMWVDLLVIPVDAPHPDAAYRLLDYLLEPDVIAEVSNASRFANANRDATSLVDPGIRDDPAIYPPAAVQSRLHLVPAESQAYTRLRTRMWTRVRDGVQ
jgi:putrescine transport system substrate-binding protein